MGRRHPAPRDEKEQAPLAQDYAEVAPAAPDSTATVKPRLCMYSKQDEDRRYRNSRRKNPERKWCHVHTKDGELDKRHGRATPWEHADPEGLAAVLQDEKEEAEKERTEKGKAEKEQAAKENVKGLGPVAQNHNPSGQSHHVRISLRMIRMIETLTRIRLLGNQRLSVSRRIQLGWHPVPKSRGRSCNGPNRGLSSGR